MQPPSQPPAHPPPPGDSSQPWQPSQVVNVHNHIQYQAPPSAPPVIVTGHPHRSTHMIHLALTVLTCGLWAPLWIIHAIVLAASNKPTAVYAPPFVPLLQTPGPPSPRLAPPQDQNQRAIAAITQQRNRRKEARSLAVADPMAAKQLLIGRRDVAGRQYDDGGLIDINRVPAEVFSQVLRVSEERAAHIVAVRNECGDFSSVSELMVMADLPHELSDDLREFAIIIP